MLGALLAGRETYGLRGVRLLQVACALHGLAGLAAADRFGERGVLATDLCAELGRVPAAVAERLIALKPLQAQRREAAPQTAAKSAPDLRSVLGRHVRVTVDRPVGSRHPDHKDVVYSLNYGYVADVPPRTTSGRTPTSGCFGAGGMLRGRGGGRLPPLDDVRTNGSSSPSARSPRRGDPARERPLWRNSSVREIIL